MRRLFFVVAIVLAMGILSMHYPSFLGDAWALLVLAAMPLTKEPRVTVVVAAAIALVIGLMGLAFQLDQKEDPK